MSPASPPLWLLDIDGVLNALAHGWPPEVWGRQEWVQRTIITPIDGRGTMTLPILAARPILDFVTRVHASGAAEVRWHSTWRAAAVTAFAPALGLPMTIPFSIAPEWTDRPARVWWKLPAARRALAAGRRLVWTDDDICEYPDQTRDLFGADALLISPDSRVGLTREHVARISEFLQIQ